MIARSHTRSLTRRGPGVRPSPRTALSALAALALAATAAVPTPAQERPPLQGVVADEATRALVPGAAVTLVGSGLETRTRADGTFAFPDAPLGSVSLRVRAPGYPSVVQQAEVRSGTVLFLEILLPRVDAVLEELIVSARTPGEAGGGEPRNAAELLALEVPGLHRSSGNLGVWSDPVLLRGRSSITLSAEPAVYVDGVRMSGDLGEVMDVLSRIPASDVESIQVLRGPAAAFLQGAANGAIVVKTRSGPGGG